MLYLLLYYILVSCICFWAGLIIYSFMPTANSEKRSILHFLMTGLMALTAAGEWKALFSPVNGIALIWILIILSVITFFRKEKLSRTILRDCHTTLKREVLFLPSLFCFLIMILVLNAGPSMMDDSESYHIQMVKWIQEFGSVPGLANLHLRFGFNSSWFSSIGLLSYPFPGFNSYFSLNGLIGLWFCYFLLERIFTSFSDISSGKINSQAWGYLVILIFCFINWPMIRGCITSANYDFIITICVIVLFSDLFKNAKNLPAEWLIWPIFLFTVRMINAPLLLLSLIYIFYSKPFSIRQCSLAAVTGILFVVPFLARNIILSGYPFFPVYKIDWFSPDWKADRSRLVEISQYIKYFNRVNPMFLPMNETMTLRFPGWIASWYRYLFTFDKWLLTVSLLGYGFILVRIKRFSSTVQRFFLFVMVFQLLCWFVLAPDPRFVQGALLFGIYAGIQMLPAMAIPNGKVLKFVTCTLAGFVLLYGVSKVLNDSSYRNFLAPARLPVPAVQTISVDHIEVHLPHRVLNNWNPRCYDLALPCLYMVDPRLEARGDHIGNGFRLRKDNQVIPVDGEYKIKR